MARYPGASLLRGGAGPHGQLPARSRSDRQARRRHRRRLLGNPGRPDHPAQCVDKTPTHLCSTNHNTVVKSLVNFARSPTWIAPQFVGRLAPDGRATAYTEEQKQKFRSDPEYLKQYRREVDHELNGRFPNFYKGSAAQKASREIIEKSMREKLTKMDPELREKLIPDFDVGCRR